MYDVKNYLGTQIENFMNAYANADLGALKRINQSIMGIIKTNDGNNEILKTIKEWHTKKEDETKTIWKKTYIKINESINKKEYDNLFEEFKKIETETAYELNELESDYWNSLRDLFLKVLAE